jgi:dipeptidyl-peptidase 4
MRNYLLILLLVVTSAAQAQKISIEDAVLKQNTTFRPASVSQLQWLPAIEFVSFAENNEMVIEDAKGRARSKITVSELNTSTGSTLKNIPRISWIDDNEFYFYGGEEIYRYNWIKKSGSKWVSTNAEMENFKLHSKSGNVAYTVGNNVWVMVDGKSRQVTKLDSGIVAGQAIARSEFGITEGLFWSNDGNKLAFYQKDERNVTDYPLVDYTTMPAGPHFIKYPMAGSHGELASAGLYDLKNNTIVYLDVNNGVMNDKFYITNLSFTPDGKYVLAAIVNREQNHMDLISFDASTGAQVRVLFSEDNEKYVEPEHTAIFLPGQSDQFLWFSERNGMNNLYLYNMQGKLLRNTTAPFPIREFIGFGYKGKEAIVTGQGMHPTEQNAYIINLGNMNVVGLSSPAGTHNILVSGVGNHIIDQWSSLEVPYQAEIRNTKGKVIRTLMKSKNPLEGYEIGETQIFSIKADDGTDLWCRMITPPNMKNKQKHPVIVYTYNGPHVQLVTNSWMGGAPLWMHTMAAEGYIVFTLDGRGSDNRGLQFEQAVFRNLGDQEIEDQETGVEYLRKQSFVDPERMAIHGWSFGGFMTTSLMLRKPDLFKVGVAGGPVIDWNLYEIMYTERYMDTPQENPEGYAKANLTKYVGNLKGKLLMIHGAEDDVVVLQHNMSFLKACVDKGKQVDFFVYPGHPHNVRGKDRAHLMVKVLNYITDNL